MRVDFALAAGLLPSVLAVFADEAGQVDFHYALLGLPQSATTFFHQPFLGSKASLLYTLSEKSVIGAVNPKDGANVWRQALPPGESPVFLKAGEDQDTVISASSNTVSAWSASDGKLSWDIVFQNSHVLDVEVLELPVSQGVPTNKDIVVLLGGTNSAAQRLDANTGAVKWKYEDDSGDVPYRISASATTLFLVSYHTTTLSKGIKLKVTSLDPVTGQKLEQHTLGSDGELSALSDIRFVGSNSASRILAWTDQSKQSLKVNVLGTSRISTFDIRSTSATIEMIAVHAAHRHYASPHFLVHYQTTEAHWAEVFHVDLKSSTISKAYDLPSLAGQGAFSAAVVDANVYFTRITADEVILVSSVSHGILERWTLDSLKTSSLTERSHPIQATSEVVARSGSSFAVRSAVLLSSGDWVLVRNGERSWSRPEALAGVVKAVWASDMEIPALAETLEIESHGNPVTAYVHRVRRHLQDWRSFSPWVRTLPSIFLHRLQTFGVTGGSDLTRVDVFGYNKLIIVATENGRLVALEAGNHGRIAWNVKGDDLAQGVQWTASSAGPLLAELQSMQSLDLEHWRQKVGVGSKPANQHQTNTPEVKVSYKIKDGSVVGYKRTDPLWHFTPGNGQRIVSATPLVAGETVASIGKVLGDRTVLYKYLNPNTVLITGVNDGRRRASVYLLDAVSGTVLYTATHQDVDTSRPIATAISENWFAYSLTIDPADDSSSKGFELVFAELFESSIPNDRGALAANVNSSTVLPSALASKPVVISQTFHVEEEISCMGVTQTAQGITSRQLLVTLSGSNSIVAIPRQALDPRRVIGKDPTRPELEEGLSRYAPDLQFDPKWYLNHKEEVLGVKKIIAAPAQLESTSLIFAYGHDLFGTRISPSFAFDVLGNNFNKIQLVLTVVALTVGVFFVAPLIQRKQTDALWQNS